MSQLISRLTAMLLIVALPLAWGLGVEHVFQLLRQRNAAQSTGTDQP